MSNEMKKENSVAEEPRVQVAKTEQRRSGQSRHSTTRSDDNSSEKSSELQGSPSSDNIQQRRNGKRSSRSPKSRNSGRRRSVADEKEDRDSSRKSQSSRRRSSTTRRGSSSDSLCLPSVGLSISESSLAQTRSKDGGDRSTSLSPRPTYSDDRDAKGRSSRSSRATTPGIENVTDSISREARKSARARASKSHSLSPRRNDEGDNNSPSTNDQDAKRRSRQSSRATAPGVQAVTEQSTREARKSARRSSTTTRRSGTSSRSRTPPPNRGGSEDSLDPTSAEIDSNLERIRQQEERNRRAVAMAEVRKKSEERDSRRRRLCWICFCVLLLLLGVGIATFIILRTQDIKSSSSAADQVNSVAATDAPTNKYLFEPPTRQDCANLRLKRPLGDRKDTLQKDFDLHFDALLGSETETDVWNLEFLTAIEEYLLPSLLGCDDAVDRRSMVRGSIHRKLATLRYIIGDAVVTGRVDLETPCLPENDSELCFRSIVTLQIFLKDDVDIGDLIKLIVGVVENEKFEGVSLMNSNRLLRERVVDVEIPLVDRWVLQNTFENVFYIRIEERGSGLPSTSNSTLSSLVPSEAPSSNPTSLGGGGGSPTTPTRAPSNVDRNTKMPTVSPTPPATKRPTRPPAPGVTQPPTLEPSRKPSTLPSLAPSVNPTPTPPPTQAPVPGATQPPTKKQSLSPTLEPKTGRPILPTKAPVPKTPAPTMATASPSRAPTSGPTFTPTPAPTSGPTFAPTIAPTPVPTSGPTSRPTRTPTSQPTSVPTSGPTSVPTLDTADNYSAEPTARPVTILDFDDLTGASGECLVDLNEINDGYKGFQWDYFGVSDISCATSGAEHSSPNGAGPMSEPGNAFGETMSFQLNTGGSFDLISVEAFHGDGSCPFTLYGYRDGEVTPSYDLDVSPSSTDWFTIDLSSFIDIAKFEFFTTCTGPLTIIFDDFKMYMNRD